MTDALPNPVAAVRWLGRSWWLLFPAFSALTWRLDIDRACANPYDLLPALTTNPASAWAIALVYVLAHVWMVAVYVTTASAAGTLRPPVDRWRGMWGRDVYKILAIAAAIAIEYAPLELWRWLGTMGICGAGN
jgi:hypothetical protein